MTNTNRTLKKVIRDNPVTTRLNLCRKYKIKGRISIFTVVTSRSLARVSHRFNRRVSHQFKYSPLW